MNRQLYRGWMTLGLLLLGTGIQQIAVQAQDDNEANERAIKEAVEKVKLSVVRIETSGGQDIVVWVDPATRQPIRKVVGPTTGLVVSADGLIITSSFNFANNPTDIFVTVPGGRGRGVAKVIAKDETRMLTLLKVDLKDLPVPVAVPKKEIEVGQWSIGLGRAIDPNIDRPPTIATGIISAVGRVWGKAVQTDAKISPINYGGPLIGIDGRVQGVLVPASPQGEGENAGVEWYDSGIGFAIPLEDILNVLPKMREGSAEKPIIMKPGLLGFTPKDTDLFGPPPTIGTVAPESSAEKAGLKPGDVILEVDGKVVHNQAQVLHILRPKYAGDTVTLKVRRGKEEKTFENLMLASSQTAFEHGFLGILPMRDDPELGVEIRHVYPNSPADQLKLMPGDRIMKIAPVPVKELTPFSGRDQFAFLMSNLRAKTEVHLEVKRKDGKTEKLQTRLATITDDVLDVLSDEPTKRRALETPKPLETEAKKGLPRPKKDGRDGDEQPKKEIKTEVKKEEIKTGLFDRFNQEQNRKYWIYVPSNYDPNTSFGLVVWLHPADVQGRDKDDITDIWKYYCRKHQFIMIGPISKAKEGWAPSETEDILGDIEEVMKQYTVDRHRVVIHGSGIGGQMAYYVGFYARQHVRGVATHGAVLATQPKDNLPNQRLQFWISGGDKDTLFKEIEGSKPKLAEKKFPVTLKIIGNLGKQYLDADEETFEKMIRWIDSLDRQ